MERWFGDSVDLTGPLRFLRSHGFVERGNGLLAPPVSAHNVSHDEWLCIAFLVDEWDFAWCPHGELVRDD
jgi:hypothetical protein